MRFSDFNDETKYRIYQASRDNLIKSMNANRVGTPPATDYANECERLVGSIEAKMDELNVRHAWSKDDALRSRPQDNEKPVTIDYNVEGNQNLEYEGKTQKEIDEMKTAKIEAFKIGNPGSTTGMVTSQDLTQIQNKLADWKKRHNELESEKTRIQGELDSCKINLANEKANSKTVEETCDSLEQTLKQKGQELEEVQKLLRNTKEKLGNCESKLSTDKNLSMSSDDSLMIEKANLELKVVELENESKNLTTDLATSNKERHLFKQQLLFAQASVLQLQEDIALNNVSVSSNTQPSVDGDTDQNEIISKLEKKIETLTATLYEINAQKTDLSSEKNDLMKRIEEMSKEIERKTADLEKAVAEHEIFTRTQIDELKLKHANDLKIIMAHILTIISEDDDEDASETSKIDDDLLNKYDGLRESIVNIKEAKKDVISFHTANIEGSLKAQHSKELQAKDDVHELTRIALEKLREEHESVGLTFEKLMQENEDSFSALNSGSAADDEYNFKSAKNSPSETVDDQSPNETQQKKVEELRVDLSNTFWDLLQVANVEQNPQQITQSTSPPPVGNVDSNFKNLPSQNLQIVIETKSISPTPIGHDDSNFIKALKANLLAKNIDPTTSTKKRMIAYAVTLIETFESVMWDSKDTIENIYSVLNDTEKKIDLRTNFHTQLASGDQSTINKRFTAMQKTQTSWKFELPNTGKKITMEDQKKSLRDVFETNVFIDQPGTKSGLRSSTPLITKQ